MRHIHIQVLSRPSLPNRGESLFLSGTSKVSSSDAFDASAIVESAQSAPPAKRLRVIKTERRKFV